jgi:hypothetical protein
MAKPTEGESTLQYKKHIYIRPVIYGFRITDSSRLKMIVYTLSFHACTAGDRLKGTSFLPVYLTGAVYRDFLRNFLPELLQDVDMQTMVHAWSGALPHFLAVRAFLSKVFPEQWTGRGGPTAWPARCPDLSPLYFYLWEHLKPAL